MHVATLFCLLLELKRKPSDLLLALSEVTYYIHMRKQRASLEREHEKKYKGKSSKVFCKVTSIFSLFQCITSRYCHLCSIILMRNSVYPLVFYDIVGFNFLLCFFNVYMHTHVNTSIFSTQTKMH